MEDLSKCISKPKLTPKKRKKTSNKIINNAVNETREAGDGESITETLSDDYIDEIPSAHKITSVYVEEESKNVFKINIQLDGISISLFLLSIFSRLYKLHEPNNVVFDELHYGKYVSMYIQNNFFFSSNPPLGIQLISFVAYLSGYVGNYKFDAIGKSYDAEVPVFALRFIPAFFGSLMIPTVYHLLQKLGLSPWTAILGSLLALLDNAFLTQSRFILMESMLICFSTIGLFFILGFCRCKNTYSFQWWFHLILGFTFLTFSVCVKFVGFYSYCLGIMLILNNFWSSLSDKNVTDRSLFVRFFVETVTATVVPFLIYILVFYVHLNILYKAGPHDNIMTSAFQASLEGGLASITKGQPLVVAHGSQITLRHSHGRTCWLHSHSHVYPIRYPDGRGSSHQQQVTCYSFKDVNNWWIVKRPNKNELVVEKPIDAIKHGEIVQLVHGLTSRALNSHDVAAPMSPQCQEISCYIDYNVSMPAQNLWKVDIINREQVGDVWHAIQSQVHLIHVVSNQALKFSGKQLPDWGFHQHEVVADRIIHQDDTIWNVEEHLYTKSEDQKDRERDIIASEMIPMSATKLSFWNKFYELQYKMLFKGSESVQSHMFSSEPFEWPLMTRGIAYWISSNSNAQIHLIGNIITWYSGTFSIVIYCILLIFYLLRRRRLCFDLNEQDWEKFTQIGLFIVMGYCFHYFPYFFVERTLFLHNYLHAYYFKVCLIAALIEHIFTLLRNSHRTIARLFILLVLVWIFYVFLIFKKLSVLSYGTSDLTLMDLKNLKWKQSWDFIFHRK